jgi:hypothetical protein
VQWYNRDGCGGIKEKHTVHLVDTIAQNMVIVYKKDNHRLQVQVATHIALIDKPSLS